MKPYLGLPDEDPAGLQFDSTRAPPPGEAYEAFIARTGSVPTRPNLHDAFNRLVWRRHPALKKRLNELHVQEMQRLGPGAPRGAARDALTLFDEFGAWWPDPPAELERALRARDWKALFLLQRDRWSDHRFQIVGHALLEQLTVAPRKSLTAHVLMVDDPLSLTPQAWARKPMVPMPVLGMPGWWPGNAESGFYDDPSVFRPAKP